MALNIRGSIPKKNGIFLWHFPLSLDWFSSKIVQKGPDGFFWRLPFQCVDIAIASFRKKKNSAPNQYREVIQTKSLRQNDAPPPVTHSGGPSSEASSALQWPPDAPPYINDLSDYKCSVLSWFIFFRCDMKLNLHLLHFVKQWIKGHSQENQAMRASYHHENYLRQNCWSKNQSKWTQ